MQSGERGGDLGTLLRHWRTSRQKSQLDVAMDAGVSQRQFSFIESGRSAPKRETLLAIAGALEIPLRERNALLLAGGFAPIYSDAAWTEPEMRSIRTAVERMLQQQEPYPAILMDRYWNVLTSNDATLRLFGSFIDMQARMGRRNLLHLMFDPTGMRPFIVEWERVAAALVQRVRHEAVGRLMDAKTLELLRELLAYPGTPEPNAGPSGSGDLPMIPLSFIHGGKALKYFSMVTTVGTPQTVAAQELRVECLYPADDFTEEQHAAWFR
jgi:transcriptional regulator with XRE-family HTH domain